MKINMRITYNDGTAVDTTAVTIDLVAFEDAFDRSVARLEMDLRLKDVCWLAWTSQRRLERTSLDFTPWLATVDNVALTDGEAEPDPLDQEASTSASPS